MNNFEVLKHYSIPSDVLMAMLDTYRMLGMNNEYLIKIGDKKDILFSDTIEKDTFFLSKLLNLEVSDNRLRLLVTKDSQPKNNTESSVKALKQVLVSIHERTAEKLSFNGSDILDYLNMIFGKNSVSFSKEMHIVKKNTRPLSKRLAFEKVVEEYFVYHTGRLFEPVFLSSITYMEMLNILPYSKHNDLAGYLALYYMMLYSKVDVFKYVSFFEIIVKNEAVVKELVRIGSLNYTDNYLQAADFVRFLFENIQKSYKELDSILKNYAFQSHAYKSDVIEETIYRKVPEYFTKDDVRRYHPDASDSTINRSLFKLRDMGIIMPLGKGRSAKWMKITKEDDLRMLFGVDYEKEN